MNNEEDTVMQQLMKDISTGVLSTDVEKAGYGQCFQELSMQDKIVMRGDRIIIPQKLRGDVIESAHMGHPGKIRMLQQLRGSTWWPGMTADVKKYEDSCIGCKASAGNNATPPMEIRDIPDRPWQHLSADYKGPIGGKYYFHVLIDNLTRWPEVAMVKSTGFEALSGKLEGTFAIHGIPDSITHDNGPCYNSRDWRNLEKKGASSRDRAHRSIHRQMA